MKQRESLLVILGILMMVIGTVALVLSTRTPVPQFLQ